MAGAVCADSAGRRRQGGSQPFAAAAGPCAAEKPERGGFRAVGQRRAAAGAGVAGVRFLSRNGEGFSAGFVSI